MRRKLLSILMTLTMVFTMMPAAAFAEVGNDQIAQIDEVQTQDIEPVQTVSETEPENTTLEYSITRDAALGGSFEGLPESAYANHIVSFTLIIGTKYNLNEGYPIVSYDGDNTISPTEVSRTVADNGVIRIQYSFTMPEADVDVSAMFTEKAITAPDGKVCQIGNNKYETLKAAIKKVRNKQTITLLSNTGAELISIRRKVTFTINSNGYENHATIIGGTGYKVTSSTDGTETTYKVSCQLINNEVAGQILNKLLNAAEPAIRVIMCIARLFSR